MASDLAALRAAAKQIHRESDAAQTSFGTPYSPTELLLASERVGDIYFTHLMQWAYQEIVELRKRTTEVD